MLQKLKKRMSTSKSALKEEFGLTRIVPGGSNTTHKSKIQANTCRDLSKHRMPISTDVFIPSSFAVVHISIDKHPPNTTPLHRWFMVNIAYFKVFTLELF